MIYALNPTMVVRWLAFVTFAAALAAVATSSANAAHALWGAKSYVLAVPSGLVFLLTIRPIFRLVHRITFASVWWFPLLDGEWEGEIHSSWPRIQAMMLAARGDAPKFNVLTDPTPETAASAPIPIAAKIESGLLDFKIALTMSASRHSHTVFVKPERKQGCRPRLYYIYRQQEDAEVPVTDAREHQGAAYLDFDSDTGGLSGAYWTARQGELGLNTAGSIRLWRKKAPRQLSF